MTTNTIRRFERLPYARRGQRLSVVTWNKLARVVNEKVLAGPKDLDGGVAGDGTPTIKHEQSRTTDTVRVFNQDDSEQWVDVARIEALEMLNTRTGEVEVWIFNNPASEGS